MTFGDDWGWGSPKAEARQSNSFAELITQQNSKAATVIPFLSELKRIRETADKHLLQEHVQVQVRRRTTANQCVQKRQEIVAQSRLIDERPHRQDKPWRVQGNAGVEHANNLDIGCSSDYGRDCHHR